MATGTTQLLASSKRGNHVSSLREEEGETEVPPTVPQPVKDGLPQVKISIHTQPPTYT